MLKTFLIILSLFFILMPTIYAYSEPVKVTVATPDIYPLSYLNSKNEITGTLVNCLNNNSNKKYTFHVVILPWARALQEVKGNRVNAIMPAVYTKQRATYLAYPDIAIFEFLSDVLVKKVSTSFTSFEIAKIQKKIIAKVRSKALTEEIKARVESAGLKILNVNDPLTGLKMLLQNRIDYFLGDPQIIKNIAQQAELMNKLSFVKLSNNTSLSYLAFSKSFAQSYNVNQVMKGINCHKPLLNQ